MEETPQVLDYQLDAYAESLANVLNNVAQEYRANNVLFNEEGFFQTALISVASKQQEFPDALDLMNVTSNWYSTQLSESIRGRSENESQILDLSELQITPDTENLLVDLVHRSSELSISEYNDYLDERIANFEVIEGGQHVEFIMLYASTLKVFTDFYENNSDLIEDGSGRIEGCASSVAGWGLFGAVVGAGLGCAVGTLLAGPVGCVAGGKLVWVGLGAVLGGAAGAAGGYAGNCGYSVNTNPTIGPGYTGTPFSGATLPSGLLLLPL